MYNKYIHLLEKIPDAVGSMAYHYQRYLSSPDTLLALEGIRKVYENGCQSWQKEFKVHMNLHIRRSEQNNCAGLDVEFV